MATNKTAFRGLNSLRVSNVDIEYHIWQAEHIYKCMNDPKYFMRSIKIITIDDGEITFTPFDYQARLIDTVYNNRFTVSLMPRQSGKSQTLAALIVHYIIFNKHKTVAILANKMSAAKETFSRVQEIYESLPQWLKHGVVEWNKTSLTLENGCEVFCAPTSKSSIRGRTISFLLLDEFAFVQNATEFYTSTYPVVSSGKTSKIAIISTPYGENLFKSLYEGALEKTNQFVPFRADWWEHPDRDEAWRLAVTQDIGQQAFDQEYGLNFAGSGGTLIIGPSLSRMRAKQPIADYNVAGLKIYEQSQEGHIYLLIADTAEGVGGEADSSAITVFDITDLLESDSYKIVASYKNNEIAPEDFSGVIASIGRIYNDAFIANENNSIGRSVGVDLINYHEYDNVIRTKNDKGQTKFSGKGRIPGIRTTSTVKKMACARLKNCIEKGILDVIDRDTIQELFSFVKKGNGKYEAMNKTDHDDMVATLWLGTYVMYHNGFRRFLAMQTDFDGNWMVGESNTDEQSEDASDSDSG